MWICPGYVDRLAFPFPLLLTVYRIIFPVLGYLQVYRYEVIQ